MTSSAYHCLYCGFHIPADARHDCPERDNAQGYPPTPRQMDLLRFIAGFQEVKGTSPTFDEMAAGIGLSAKSSILKLLARSAERGHLRRLPNRARAIELLHPVAFPRDHDGKPMMFVRVG